MSSRGASSTAPRRLRAHEGRGGAVRSEGAGMLRIAVLVGSPRKNGACARFAAELEDALHGAGVVAELLFLSDYEVLGCVGCGACERTGACVLDAREGGGGRPGFACLLKRLQTADALALVAPVYFSGPPSQLKAVLDRMQPLWCQRYLLGQRPVRPLERRRPLDLFVVGAGGDPFGYNALVSCACSSLRMADFELHATHDLVGFGQAPRPACAYGPDFDAALLFNLSTWASGLVHAAQAAHDLR